MSEFSAFSRGLMAGYSVVNDALNQKRRRELEERQFQIAEQERQRRNMFEDRTQFANEAFNALSASGYEWKGLSPEVQQRLSARAAELGASGVGEDAVLGLLYSHTQNAGALLKQGREREQAIGYRGLLSQRSNDRIAREVSPFDGKPTTPVSAEGNDRALWAAKQAGLPPELVAKTVGAESAGGRITDNGGLSTARGEFQVLEGTFNDVNKNQFGGKLNWDDEWDVALAGATYLKQQLDKYQDPDLARAAYFIGPGKVDELMAEGGIDAVYGYKVPGQGREITVDEYLKQGDAYGLAGEEGALKRPRVSIGDLSPIGRAAADEVPRQTLGEAVRTGNVGKMPILPPAVGSAVSTVGGAVSKVGQAVGNATGVAYGTGEELNPMNAQSIAGAVVKPAFYGAGSVATLPITLAGGAVETAGEALKAGGHALKGTAVDFNSAKRSDIDASRELRYAKANMELATKRGNKEEIDIARSRLQAAERQKAASSKQLSSLDSSAPEYKPARPGTPEVMQASEQATARAEDAIAKAPNPSNPNPNKDRISTQVISRGGDPTKNRKGVKLSKEELDALAWLEARDLITPDSARLYRETGMLSGPTWKVLQDQKSGEWIAVDPATLQTKVIRKADAAYGNRLGAMYKGLGTDTRRNENLKAVDEVLGRFFDPDSKEFRDVRNAFLNELVSGTFNTHIPPMARYPGGEVNLGALPTEQFMPVLHAFGEAAASQGFFSRLFGKDKTWVELIGKGPYEQGVSPQSAQQLIQLGQQGASAILGDPAALLEFANEFGLSEDEAVEALNGGMPPEYVGQVIMALQAREAMGEQ